MFSIPDIPPGYKLALKLGLAGAIALFGVGAGCHLQKGLDQKAYDSLVAKKGRQLTDAAKALQADADQLHANATAFRTISAHTRAELAASKAREAAATAQADGAREDAKASARRVKDAQKELDRAKANPDCKRLLETRSCAAFR